MVFQEQAIFGKQRNQDTDILQFRAFALTLMGYLNKSLRPFCARLEELVRKLGQDEWLDVV
jgi:hypothetical protein